MIGSINRRAWLNAFTATVALTGIIGCDNTTNHQPPTDDEPVLSTRSIDGSDNNPQLPDLGSAGTMLARQAKPEYADAVSQMTGANRPNPRAISNTVHAHPPSPVPNRLGATDFVWQWGQFLDHDIGLTDGADPHEMAPIPIPSGDPHFDPANTGTAVMAFRRSVYSGDSGTGPNNPRQQLNMITTWIDASNVYGSDMSRANALRVFDGSGRLKVSQGNLLPFNISSLPNAMTVSPEMFLAGDVRANEQSALTALHTVFVREHNRLAASIRIRDPLLTGEQIYQRARRIVGAQMQAITYNEFLPVLLGQGAISPYTGYNESVDASLCNVFSTALYRFGHSALSPVLMRLDASGQTISQGHLPLRDAFFEPSRILDEGGIEPLLRGLASQVHEDIDVFVIDDVRNMLFGPPGTGGFDLASLNIQRGRDHGLPAYNDVRIAYGLAPADDFSDISSDPDVQLRLSQVYATVDDVDVWVGALAEDHVSGMVGELVYWALTSQFELLRNGDRFWYERTLTPAELREVATLAEIIRRNTSIDEEIQDNVFLISN